MQRALEHYTDLADIKRIMQQGGGTINPEFLLTYFGTISREGSLEVLKDLLTRNLRQNLNIVVQIATKYSDALGPENLMKLFEDFKSFEGLFYYLGAIVNNSQASAVHLKYIQAAARMQQFKEVCQILSLPFISLSYISLRLSLITSLSLNFSVFFYNS
jgi:clathrin heavy chain